MKKQLFIWLMVLQGTGLFGQSFSALDTLQLHDLVEPVFEWVDIDNDGLLDMFVTGRDITVTDSSRSISYIYHQLSDTSFTRLDVDLETFGTQLIRLADLNMDGKQDLLISATNGANFEHVMYENQGDLTFSKTVITRSEHLYWEELQLADLDNDGLLEIITSGTGGFTVYKNVIGAFTRVDLRDDLNEVKTAPVILDFDKNGFLDIFLAGTKADGDSVAYMLLNDKEFQFAVRSLKSDSLKITDYVVSDFNDDGLPDLLVSHDINDDVRSMELLLNKNGTDFERDENDDRIGFRNAKVFAADLTSDGLVDTDAEGITIGATGNLLARQRLSELSTEMISQRDTLENSSGQGRRYGDFDFDGDLDYFEVTTHLSGSVLWLFVNDQEVLNNGPDQLEDLLSFRFQNELYIVWNTAADDFTKSPSVTYDVALGTSEEEVDVLAAGFDPVSLKRTVVGRGNQGSNSFLILNNPPQQTVYASIMPIDNAFHYSVSECLRGAIESNCNEELVVQEKVLCDTNQILLQTETGEQAKWFSVSGGYLGTFAQLNYTTNGRDFIIAVYDRVGGCIDGEIFELIPEPGLPDLFDMVVCPEAFINREVEGEWSSIQWTSNLSGVVSNTANLSFQPEGDDLITVDVVSRRGCSFQQSFTITLDGVTASVQDSVFQIVEGESVQLFASGGTEYSWSPEIGLSSSDIPNPFAMPDETTLYTVTVTNDIGCIDELEVRIEVIQMAFAPDVFSPNGDGRNESFKVYDLEKATSFKFSIFDRVGNLVFESTNLNEVTVAGWDGTKGGQELPTGTYFWRVSGEYGSGQGITVNGKKSGALQLIR